MSKIYIHAHGLVDILDMIDGKRAIDVNVMGPALAKINRFAGNSMIPWNDAEHSILVADIAAGFVIAPWQWSNHDAEAIKPYLAATSAADRKPLVLLSRMWGLLHDVVECVVGDVPAPVKRLCGESRAEHHIGEHIFRQQIVKRCEKLDGISITLVRDAVKFADRMALLVEVYALHPSESFDYCCETFQVSQADRDTVARLSGVTFGDRDHSHTWGDSARRWTEALGRARGEWRDYCNNTVAMKRHLHIGCEVY